jgi:hydroxymethylpyrimidine/phosphomethylpyrimidine kinase
VPVPTPIYDDQTSRVVREPPHQVTVLVVAGFDPSGGAGILADARLIEQHGFHCAGVVTALTEQDSLMCSWMHPVAPEIVSNQLARLIDDFEIGAVKVGMLANQDVAGVVARILRRLSLQGVPVVIDPVLRATRGVPLLEGSPQLAYGAFLELATLITPNLGELATLTGRDVKHPDEMRDAAERLRAKGPKAVLAKGGHIEGDPVDILVDSQGEMRFTGGRVEGPTPHGTGCALSTDIACRLAIATPLREAVQTATARVRQLIADARSVGRGRPFLG